MSPYNRDTFCLVRLLFLGAPPSFLSGNRCRDFLGAAAFSFFFFSSTPLTWLFPVRRYFILLLLLFLAILVHTLFAASS